MQSGFNCPSDICEVMSFDCIASSEDNRLAKRVKTELKRSKTIDKLVKLCQFTD